MDTTTDREVQIFIEELVPELKVPEKPKRLGFWGAMKKVTTYWKTLLDSNNRKLEDDREMGKVISYVVSFGAVLGATIQLFITPGDGLLILGASFLGTLSAFFYSVLWALLLDGVEKILEVSNDLLPFLFLFPTLSVVGWHYGHDLAYVLPVLPLATWVGQAFYWMRKSSREVREALNTPNPKLPSIQVIQERLFVHTEKVVRETREQVVSRDSEVSRRISLLNERISEARVVIRYFEKRLKDDSKNERLKQNLEKARIALEMFLFDLQKLSEEQEVAVRFFNEIESSIPIEKGRLADEEYENRLAMLLGEAEQARQISREIIEEAVRPALERIRMLGEVREQLLLHATAIIEGPSLVRRIEAVAVSAAQGRIKLHHAIDATSQKLGVDEERLVS